MHCVFHGSSLMPPARPPPCSSGPGSLCASCAPLLRCCTGGWAGYMSACMTGGITGFALALGASTGPVSTAGFGLLAIVWTCSTAIAWRRAARRDFAAHRRWMIRSFALTFAAVTLRLYLPIAPALPVTFEDAYRAISFLCWVPNLLLAEFYIRLRTVRP